MTKSAGITEKVSDEVAPVRDEIRYELIVRVSELAGITKKARVERLFNACKYHYVDFIDANTYRRFGFTKEEQDRIEEVLDVGRLMVLHHQLPIPTFLTVWNDYMKDVTEGRPVTLKQKYEAFYVKWTGALGEYLLRKAKQMTEKYSA